MLTRNPQWQLIGVVLTIFLLGDVLFLHRKWETRSGVARFSLKSSPQPEAMTRLVAG